MKNIFTGEKIPKAEIIKLPPRERMNHVDAAVYGLQSVYENLQLSSRKGAENLGQYASAATNDANSKYQQRLNFQSKYQAMLDLQRTREYINAPEPEPIVPVQESTAAPVPAKTILDEPVTVFKDLDNDTTSKMIIDARRAVETSAIPKERSHESIA